MSRCASLEATRVWRKTERLAYELEHAHYEVFDASEQLLAFVRDEELHVCERISSLCEMNVEVVNMTRQRILIPLIERLKALTPSDTIEKKVERDVYARLKIAKRAMNIMEENMSKAKKSIKTRQ